LLRSTRQQHHQRIAHVLAAQFPDIAATQPELLAHHYTQAGLREEAIVYWQRAGERALESSANVEAISHITTGLELLKLLPDTPERTRQELGLYTILGAALMATKGYGAPELEQVYAWARELCQQVGETPQLFHVLAGLRVFYMVRAELQTAHEIGEQLLRLAQRIQDPALLSTAHRAFGTTSYHRGEFLQARAHLEQGIALYDLQQHRPLTVLYGNDPGVIGRSWAAEVLWFLGYPDQALQRNYEALTLARGHAHAFSLAFALFHVAAIHQLRREARTAQEIVEAVITLATEQGFPYWLPSGTFLRGWILTEQGQTEEGITQIRQSITTHQAIGTEEWRPYWLAYLAAAYGKSEQAEAGHTLLVEALTIVHNTGECFYEAELYRLKGELLLSLSADNHAEAEGCFHQALDVAQRQHAKSLELRAATSLSRLWQQQGKREEARQLLAEIYGWFTEGFDTADLQEAKALLEELS
jgi:predicted ATPase